MVLGGSRTVATGPHHAPLRLPPPLVSFIALFDSAPKLPLRLATSHGNRLPARTTPRWKPAPLSLVVVP